MEKSTFKSTLYKHNLHKANAGDELGVARQNMNYYMDKFELEIVTKKTLIDHGK